MRGEKKMVGGKKEKEFVFVQLFWLEIQLIHLCLEDTRDISFCGSV